jgi:hypothetical protein
MGEVLKDIPSDKIKTLYSANRNKCTALTKTFTLKTAAVLPNDDIQQTIPSIVHSFTDATCVEL